MLGWVQDVPLQIDKFTIVKTQTNTCIEGRQVKMEYFNELFPLKFTSLVDH